MLSSQTTTYGAAPKPQNLPGATPVSNNWLPGTTQVPGVGYVRTPTGSQSAQPAAPAPQMSTHNSQMQAGQNTLAQIQLQNQIRQARLGTAAPAATTQQPQNNQFQSQLTQLLQQLGGGQTTGQPAGQYGSHSTAYRNSQPVGGAGNFVAPQIGVGPIWNQAQVGQATNGLQNAPMQQPATPNVGQGAQGALSQMLADSMAGAGSAAAINFGRDAAFRNADHVRSANQSNVGRGLDAANLAASQYTSQLGFDNAQRNLLMSLLGSFA